MPTPRKRRRKDGRLESPPLASAPLLTRNLHFLPIGLTQLPNDAQFVQQLREDIDDLITTFSERYILEVARHGASFQRSPQDASTPASSTTEPRPSASKPFPSSFHTFTQVWIEKGFHLIQFAFGDHTDSKCAFGNSMCRVLLKRLSPHVRLRNDALEKHTGQTFAFADLKQLMEAVAVPYSMYVFWETQLYPISGIGIKDCKRAMETIAIEQDYYDWILEFPHQVLEYLQLEQLTRDNARRITFELVDIIFRLCGSHREASEREPTSDDGVKKAAPTQNAIFDIIPHSSYRTRRPRIWPSVRVMSTLEANKEFRRFGSIVRVNEHSGDQNQVNGEAEAREVVAGLSRGDLIRLRARQRLDLAISDLPELQPASVPEAASSSSLATSETNNPSHGPHAPEVSQSSEATESRSETVPEAKRYRYEIDIPPWTQPHKYTAKMRPWLDVTSQPLENALSRLAGSRDKYIEARTNLMPSATAQDFDQKDGVADAAAAAPPSTDFGLAILDAFYAEAMDSTGDRNPSRRSASADPEAVVAAQGNVSIEQLYQAATERATRALLATREEVTRRTRHL